jgi:hypothetical protein
VPSHSNATKPGELLHSRPIVPKSLNVKLFIDRRKVLTSKVSTSTIERQFSNPGFLVNLDPDPDPGSSRQNIEKKNFLYKNPKIEIFICLCNIHYKVPYNQEFSFSFLGPLFWFLEWKPDPLPITSGIRKLTTVLLTQWRKLRDVMTTETLNLKFRN